MITFCVSISRPPSHRLSPTRRCFGFTLLHAAVRYQNTAALLLLLEHGAVDIRSRDKEGKTPFDYAVLSSDVGMIRAMLDCANAGKTKMPNLEVALKNENAQAVRGRRTDRDTRGSHVSFGRTRAFSCACAQ